MSWEGWSEVGRWENSEVAQSERWKRNEVEIWEMWEGSEQRRWMNLRTKFIFIAPVKRNVSRNPLQGFNNRFIMF